MSYTYPIKLFESVEIFARCKIDNRKKTSWFGTPYQTSDWRHSIHSVFLFYYFLSFKFLTSSAVRRSFGFVYVLLFCFSYISFIFFFINSFVYRLGCQNNHLIEYHKRKMYFVLSYLLLLLFLYTFLRFKMDTGNSSPTSPRGVPKSIIKPSSDKDIDNMRDECVNKILQFDGSIDYAEFNFLFHVKQNRALALVNHLITLECLPNVDKIHGIVFKSK